MYLIEDGKCTDLIDVHAPAYSLPGSLTKALAGIESTFSPI